MKNQIIRFILFLILIISCTILYARYIGTTGLKIKNINISTNKINTSYNNLKIVHFSDLHYKRIITNEEVTNIINEINKSNPDLVFFSGDLIDRDTKLSEKKKDFIIKSLKNIDPKLGKYAVIGNHDYDIGIDIIKEIYTKSDFILLDNEYDIIYNENNDKIFLGGLSTSTYKKADIDKVMSYFNDKEDNMYKIILMHEPDYVDKIIKKYQNIDLILAGHSHNGQVRLPVIGALYTPSNAKKYYDEYYKINNTDLYISSGIGVSRYNFRLFNRPSINIYKIIKED